MRMKLLYSLPVALTVAFAATAPAFAKSPVNTPRPSAKAQTAASGFRAEFLTNLDDVQEKILDLAESIPADKYAWRPAPDVRSTSEVFMHIAGGNYFLSTFLGMDPPKMNGDIEKVITKKADVVAELKRSFEHLRNAVNAVGDLEKPVKMFGTQTTYRGVLVTVVSHLHEHLGQSVAYARINGIVPPWSR
jgi:uncharacterized damage-inducible protein DinB